MNTIERHAHAQDIEREKISATATRAFASIRARMRRAAINAWRSGNDVGRAVHVAAGDMPTLIQQMMVAGHLAGAVRSIRTADRAKGRTIALANPFEDAMRRFEKMVTIEVLPASSPGLFDTLASMYRGPALDAATLWTTHATERLVGAVTESIARGEHVAAGTSRLREAFDSVGLGNNDAQIATVFRTQANAAYNGGRWSANQDAALDEIIWGYQYVAVGDDRTTPLCLELDGVRMPKRAPFWARWWPPRHFNCRSSTVELFTGDPDASVEAPPPDAILEALPGYDAQFSGNFGMLVGV